MGIIKNPNLVRNKNNTIDSNSRYFELNQKAEQLCDDIVNHIEEAIIDTETELNDKLNSFETEKQNKLTELDNKKDELLSIAPDNTYYTKDYINNIINLNNNIMSYSEFKSKT